MIPYVLGIDSGGTKDLVGGDTGNDIGRVSRQYLQPLLFG